MSTALELLTGEMERLFSGPEMKELCATYLDIDPEAEGIADGSKSVFARKLVAFCNKNHATEALLDVIVALKKGMVDPSIYQIYEKSFAAEKLQPGTAVMSFIIEEELREESLGTVYWCQGKDKEDKLVYLYLNVINAKYAFDREAVERFIVLMRILKANHNPRIQGIEAVGKLRDGRPFSITREVDGTPLRERLPLWVPEALDVFESVLDAVETIHERKIVHGNLKVENVTLVYTKEGKPDVVLGGFGAERLVGIRGSFLGRSPEQARHEVPDACTDIYALGALLYEAVAGKPPFEGDTEAELKMAHLAHPILPLIKVSEEPTAAALDDFIAVLMAKDPASRPQDIDEVRQLLENTRREVEKIEARAANLGTREDIALAIATLFEYPTDADSLEQLFASAKAHNAWAAAIEVMEEAASAIDEPEQAKKLLLVAADTAFRKAKDYVKALNIYEYFLSEDPNDTVVRNAVFEVLEAAGRYDELVQRMGEVASVIEDGDEKIRILMRIARIYEKKIKDPATAFGYYMGCLTGTETDKELLEPLEKLAEQTGRFAELTQSLGEAAQTAESSANFELATFLYNRLGSYYISKMEQPAYAMTCYQKVLEYAPNNKDALLAMGDLYRGAQQWVELSQVIMRLAEVEIQPIRKRNYMVEAAELFYERMGNMETAVSLVETVLGEDPAHKSAVDLMREILKAHGEWERLAKLLTDSFGLISDPAEQVATQIHIGEIYENQLKDAKTARLHYEKALSLDGTALDALKGLERIYTVLGDNVALKGNLEAQLSTVGTPKQRVELLERLAGICEEEFKDYGKAIDYWNQVLEADDTHRFCLISLTRLYRRAERWEDLIIILEKRAMFSNDDEKKELLKERAEILRDKLKDTKRAIEALTEITSLGADDALMSLAKTQEETGDYAAAAGTMRKIVDTIGDPATMQSLLIKIAQMELEKLNDADASVKTLRRAKDVDPTNRTVLSMLKQAMLAKHNYVEALNMIDQEAKVEEEDAARAELFAQMGVICLENLSDPDRAMDYFREAVSLDENNFAAGYYLVKLLRQKGLTEEAVPFYKRLADASALLDGARQVELFSEMGDTYASLDRTEDAFKAYSRATDVANVDFSIDLMLKFGRLGLEREEFGITRDKLLYYFNQVQENLTDEQKVALLIILSKALLAQKSFSDANKYLRQVMTLSPDHQEARILLANVQGERGDYRPMVETLVEVAGQLDKEDEKRIEYLKRAATVLFEKLRDAESAVSIINQVLEVRPDDRSLLGDLLKIYTATKNFAELVNVILNIAEQEEDLKKKVAYYLSAAKVYRRELHNVDQAIHYFEKVLELDPSAESANKAIIETLEENKAWDKLQTQYKKQIARLPKDATKEDKLKIYEPLFDLAHTKLRNKDDAILMAEAIAKLDPDNMARQEKVAELYGWELAHAKKAIRVHKTLLKRNPARADSLRQLYRIYSAEGNPDKTWCAASLLSLINACTPEELTYYKEYKPTDLLTFANVLEPDLWRRLVLHEDMDQTITSIFSIIQNAIYQMRGQEFARFGLDPSQAIDVTQAQYAATQYINFAAGTLGIAPPPFFFIQGVPGFRALETNPPVIVSDGNEQAYLDRVGTIFALAQELTLFYPGLFVSKMISSGSELLSWLLAAVRMFVPTLPVPDNIAGAVSDKLAPLRGSMNDFEMERLQGHVHTFVSKSAAEINLKRWAKAVSFSCDRAGLLLCGDLSQAVKRLREQVRDEALLADRLRALSLFAVSEAHFELRVHLGSALRSA